MVWPGQLTASQSQLAGPDGKGDISRENSAVDFSKVCTVEVYTVLLWLFVKSVGKLETGWYGLYNYSQHTAS